MYDSAMFHIVSNLFTYSIAQKYPISGWIGGRKREENTKKILKKLFIIQL